MFRTWILLAVFCLRGSKDKECPGSHGCVRRQGRARGQSETFGYSLVVQFHRSQIPIEPVQDFSENFWISNRVLWPPS